MTWRGRLRDEDAVGEGEGAEAAGMTDAMRGGATMTLTDGMMSMTMSPVARDRHAAEDVVTLANLREADKPPGVVRREEMMRMITRMTMMMIGEDDRALPVVEAGEVEG